jgi:uncharacterized protein (DUF1501 family)
MDPRESRRLELTRRHFLGGASLSIGGLALSSMLSSESRASQAPAPRAKRVVYLHMAGAPSNIDLFDPKPKLRELNGKPVSEELIRGERFAFIKGVPRALGSPFEFARHGASGAEVSELLPHFARIVDRVAIVRSMCTKEFNHAPAQIFMHTGHARVGRPSFGSWMSYGLGRINEDLPAFIVLTSGQFQPDGGASLWGAGFLPGEHQGVRFRPGSGVPFLADPPGVSRELRRSELDALRELQRASAEACGDPAIATRIAQYELAFRMQSSVPELLDLASEPAGVLARYGAEPGKASFANNCLLARRMLERGVRFVQLYHWGWDSHGTGESDDLLHSLPKRCQETDAASTALVEELAERGLLEDTLVIWGGEFGRTPMNEERDGSKFLGRDHHPHCFTIWLAGGGIRPGITYGATDELGYFVTENPVEVHDLHATLLHLLGIDHERLTYRSQGRDFRLTDVAGELVPALIA